MSSQTLIHCKKAQMEVVTMDHRLATHPTDTISIEVIAKMPYTGQDGILYGGEDNSAVFFVSRDQQIDIAIGIAKGMNEAQLVELAEHVEWRLQKVQDSATESIEAVVDAAIDRLTSCG